MKKEKNKKHSSPRNFCFPLNRPQFAICPILLWHPSLFHPSIPCLCHSTMPHTTKKVRYTHFSNNTECTSMYFRFSFEHTNTHTRVAERSNTIVDWHFPCGGWPGGYRTFSVSALPLESTAHSISSVNIAELKVKTSENQHFRHIRTAGLWAMLPAVLWQWEKIFVFLRFNCQKPKTGEGIIFNGNSTNFRSVWESVCLRLLSPHFCICQASHFRINIVCNRSYDVYMLPQHTLVSASPQSLHTFLVRFIWHRCPV